MTMSSSYTEAMSPTIADRFPSSQVLGASIASLSSSMSPRDPPTSISKIYRQASTLFLTRRLPEALSTVLPLVTPSPPAVADGSHEPAPVATASRTTRIKVWSLYLTILNAVVELEPEDGKEAFGTQEWRTICSKVREGEVWEEVVRDGYHGVEGDVDSDVVINLATLLLSHARNQILNQKRLESYLAASTMPSFDLSNKFPNSPSSRHSSRHRSPAKGTSGATTPRDLNARVKILELYTLHVLLRNNEWDYAREFISVSDVLDEERREAFLQALQSLHDEQRLKEKQEYEEKNRLDEQMRKDAEDARRFRAENEQREARRLEEERMRRVGSEVDYGIEQAPSHAGSSKGRPIRAQSNLAKPTRTDGAPPQAKRVQTQAPSLASRLEMAMINVRIFYEGLQATLKANPTMLFRTVAFILGLLVMFSRRRVRERISRIMAGSWSKVRATAGMGMKVSYI